MTCYHPIRGYRTADGIVFQERANRGDILGTVDLPCGQCIGCRMRRASDWASRCMHEASLWKENCFVTLTYGRDCLPAHGSLCHDDFQRFMKRVRKHFGDRKVRFYMCGEYGPLNLRPHYHACLFNVDFRSDRVVSGKSAAGAVYYSSNELASLWTHGRCSVQDLTRETAGYCARYIMHKVTGKGEIAAYSAPDADGECHPRRPEYGAMSLKPGIGAYWFAQYRRDVFPHDYLIVDGVKVPVPKYYDKLLKRQKGALFLDDVKTGRASKGFAARAECTEERLAVRETVHNARIKTLVRGEL